MKKLIKRKAMSLVETTIALSILIILSVTIITTLIPLRSFSTSVGGNNLVTDMVYNLVQTFRSDGWIATNEKTTSEDGKNIQSLCLYFDLDEDGVFYPQENTFVDTSTDYTIIYYFPLDKDLNFNPELVYDTDGNYDNDTDARYILECTVKHNTTLRQRSLLIQAKDTRQNVVCEMERSFVLFNVTLS